MPNPFLFSKFMEAGRRFSPAKVLTFLYHLPNLIRLYSRLLDDKRVPFHLKLFCYGALAYALFPFDLMPDLRLMGLGYIDDIAFIFLAFKKLVQDSPPEVVREHVLALSGKTPPMGGFEDYQDAEDRE